MSDIAPGKDTTDWELVHAPRKLFVFVWIAMAVIIVIHTIWGMWILVQGESAVTIGLADQLAFVLTGFVWAFVVGLVLRLRVRAGSAGVEVRGPLRTRLFGWDDIVGFTFPVSSRWPRLELPGYEQVAIWAIQTSDGDRAVDAMRQLKQIAREYKPSAADPASVADR